MMLPPQPGKDRNSRTPYGFLVSLIFTQNLMSTSSVWQFNVNQLQAADSIAPSGGTNQTKKTDDFAGRANGFTETGH